MSWVRQAAVAGTFYPKEPVALRAQLASLCAGSGCDARRTVHFLLAPHAGYLYSGRIAAEVYRRVLVPRTVLVLCPNHTGQGPRVSVWDHGSWQTPLGEIRVAEREAAQFLEKAESVGAASDSSAHLREHAVEVQLPFLQFLNPEVSILPVVLGPLRHEDCVHLGKAIADWLSENESAMVIASTDMSHYVSAEEARVKDELALNQWKSIDPDGLYDTVTAKRISMCGFVPTTCTLVAARRLGKWRGEVLAYGHSGAVTGDLDSVVGYAAGWIL